MRTTEAINLVAVVVVPAKQDQMEQLVVVEKEVTVLSPQLQVLLSHMVAVAVAELARVHVVEQQEPVAVELVELMAVKDLLAPMV
jgi:hypothetical protein